MRSALEYTQLAVRCLMIGSIWTVWVLVYARHQAMPMLIEWKRWAR